MRQVYSLCVGSRHVCHLPGLTRGTDSGTDLPDTGGGQPASLLAEVEVGLQLESVRLPYHWWTLGDQSCLPTVLGEDDGEGRREDGGDGGGPAVRGSLCRDEHFQQSGFGMALNCSGSRVQVRPRSYSVMSRTPMPT